MSRLTIPEAAAEMRCSQNTVRRMIKRGELPAVLVACRYLIDADSLPTSLPSRPPPPPRQPGPSRGVVSAAVREMETS